MTEEMRRHSLFDAGLHRILLDNLPYAARQGNKVFKNFAIF